MTDIIDKYKTMKKEQRDCKEWVGLYGKQYHGGGGGIGHIRSVSVKSAEIYHQESNGSKNYHTIPESFISYFEAAIKSNFGNLAREAMAMQDLAIKSLAEQAVKDHAELLREVGIKP